MQDRATNNMDKRKNTKLKIIRAAKIFSFIIAGIGLSFIAYPLYTNLVTARHESAALSAWEDQREAFSEELKENGESDRTDQDSTAAPGDTAAAETASGDTSTGDTTNGQDTDTEADEKSTGEDPAQSGGDTASTEGEMSEGGTLEDADYPGMEIDGADTEDSKYDNLTAEDFFPSKILIPKIELEWLVYEGTERETLKKGPAHESVTPLPGDTGRCTISGHRTTYGASFNRVDELETGDIIYLETIRGETFTYIVTGQEIVKPTDVWILEGSDKKELLLTACHPKYSAATRLIVIAELINIYPPVIEL